MNEIKTTFEKIQLAEFESKANLLDFNPNSMFELAKTSALYEVGENEKKNFMMKFFFKKIHK